MLKLQMFRGGLYQLVRIPPAYMHIAIVGRLTIGGSYDLNMTSYHITLIG